MRVARPGDREGVIETVAAAFAKDPAWLFLLGDGYRQLAPEFAGALFDQRVDHGSVWITSDAASVAMWDRPGQTHEDPASAQQLWRRFNALAGEPTRARLAAYNDAIKRAFPLQPCWYLGVLATVPARRGQGLAGAVLVPALERASAGTLACCLETSTQANRRFYERRGFQVDRDITISGGPQTWWMRRAARKSR